MCPSVGPGRGPVPGEMPGPIPAQRQERLSVQTHHPHLLGSFALALFISPLREYHVSLLLGSPLPKASLLNPHPDAGGGLPWEPRTAIKGKLSGRTPAGPPDRRRQS